MNFGMMFACCGWFCAGLVIGGKGYWKSVGYALLLFCMFFTFDVFVLGILNELIRVSMTSGV